jgi:sugar phosphate permease
VQENSAAGCPGKIAIRSGDQFENKIGRGTQSEDHMDTTLEQRTMRKVALRIVPFIMLLYFIAYIDRVNIGFAALTMNKDLGFSPGVFGFGAGIFFWGYFLFEVPSNIVLDKVGARLWIARVMITWGLCSAAMAFVWDATSFYVMRFLLGAAEAGFFPGIILYLSYWFPAHRRASVTSLFMAAGRFQSFWVRRYRAPCSSCTASEALRDGNGCSSWRRFPRSFSVSSCSST